MKLLIIGGSGFVSGTLARAALARGNEVWCVTRGNRSAIPGTHPILADRNDTEAFAGALADAGERWDAALDCICYNAEQARFDLRVIGQYTHRLVVVSTDSVYHPDYKTVPQNEEAPVYLTDGGYGANKREMELAIINECPADLAWTVFRPGHIFGPGSELGAYPEMTRNRDMIPLLRSGTPMRLIGGGAQYLLHPIYAPDFARVMLDCLDNEACKNQLFCMGGPEVITNRQYYELVGELLNVPVVFEDVPEEGQLAAHPAYSGYLCHRCYTLQKLADTGIALPDTPIREGLRRQIEWLIRERGY